MTSRRDFLAAAASTGLLATVPLDLSLPLHAGERAALSELDANALMADDPTDLSWVSRLKGKSRAVFDSPKVSEGGALFRAIMWRKQVNKAFGTPVEEVTPVVVFRHEAIPLVMDDEFWNHLGIGRDLDWKDPKSGKFLKENPLNSVPPDAPADMKEYTMRAFMDSGGIILACGLAFQQIVYQYTQKDKLSQADAMKRAKEHLVPGVIIQPSGFFAVLKAQDEGCKYMLGS